MADSDTSAGAWVPSWNTEPAGREPGRWWKGSASTGAVEDEGRAVRSDPSAAGEETPAAGEETPSAGDGTPGDGTPWPAMRQAMAELSDLVQELEGGRVDEPTFRRRAFELGLIRQDRDAWILDVPSGRWWRYDGIALSTLELVATPADATVEN